MGECVKTRMTKSAVYEAAPLFVFGAKMVFNITRLCTYFVVMWHTRFSFVSVWGMPGGLTARGEIFTGPSGEGSHDAFYETF